jgi:hypothetical protein
MKYIIPMCKISYFGIQDKANLNKQFMINVVNILYCMPLTSH